MKKNIVFRSLSALIFLVFLFTIDVQAAESKKTAVQYSVEALSFQVQNLNNKKEKTLEDKLQLVKLISKIDNAEDKNSLIKKLNKVKIDDYGPKDLYYRIYTAYLNVEESVSLLAYSPSVELFKKTIDKVIFDNPQWTSLSYKYSYMENNSVYRFDIVYGSDYGTILEQKSTVNKKVQEIVDKYVTNEMNDLEKVFVLHNYLVSNAEYDFNSYSANSMRGNTSTAYGALINKLAICNGYAEAMSLLLDKVGIDNKFVVGYGNNELHAWNLVKVNGKYYHLDSTWDGPLWNDKTSNSNYIRFKYFLLSDSAMSKDHNWDKSRYTECNNNEFDYLNVENSRFNPSEIEISKILKSSKSL